MNIWLCPVKPRNWRITKTFKVFGFPKTAFGLLSQVRPNDLIIFHVLKPINGIVAICRVVSEVYENHSDVWGKNRYPLRVKIEFIPNFTRDKNDPIPLSQIFFKAKSSDEFEIEPYFKNVWITKVSENQHKRLKDLFKRRQQQ